MIEKLLELLENSGYQISTIVLIIVILIILGNTENIMIWKSEIYGLFSKASVYAKKKQISNKVRGTVLKSIRDQNFDTDNIIPNDLKVVWVDKESSETFVESNQVIVRIKQSSNPHENLVTAVSEYVNYGLLHNVKRYLNKDVIDASRILMTRKIIQSADKTSLTYLDEKYIKPELECNEELKELYYDLSKIDHNGMFIGILLNEFNKSGMSIYGEIEDPELVAESKEFMRFLYNIAIGISDDSERLCFNRDYFKVSIFLTASNKTLRYYGIKPFIKAASQRLEDGIETVYIFGLGSKRDIAEQISKEISNDFRISNIKKHSYKHIGDSGNRIPGVFFECEIYKEEVRQVI